MSNTPPAPSADGHASALDINEVFRGGGKSVNFLDQINKSCIVMLHEAGIVPRATAARIASGIAQVIEQARASPPRRSADYLDYEPRLTAVVGPDASRLHSGRSRQDIASTIARMNLRDGLLREIEVTGRKMGLEVRPFRVAAAEDFDGALKAIKAWRAQALIIYTSPLTVLELKRIVSFVTANRIPSFFDWRRFAEAGGLISYGPLISEMTVQAVGQIDRILRGARPADLPVELPTRFEFVINRKTAGALGIKIPEELLLRADRVIE